MCGFAGFIDFTKKSTKGDLVNMCNVISHRGPDSGDYFIEENDLFTIGLGHRRLSIIDLHAHANQPMFYKDWVIIFNGEIYNYKELQQELIKLGHKFETSSDTEVILHAFEEWGKECVQHFIGMFAFIIYNRNTKKIYSFRDRPGVKPLHIYKTKNYIFWASEIKSFHEHPGFEKQLNLESVKSYLQLGYVPSPHSVFQNVSKQEPATIVTYDVLTKSEESEKYWNVADYYKKPNQKVDYTEAKSTMKEILISACNYRMVADVPVGVFLSGGYDSALVTSILQSTSHKQIKTFTIGIDDKKLNEASFAKEVANRLGTDHTETYITETEMLDLVKDLVFYYDEPFGDPSSVPTMLVSKIAKRHVTVALSADGGDEVFAGYNRYDNLKRLKQIRTLSRIPFIKSVIKATIKDPLTQNRLLDLIENPTAISLAKQLNNVYYEDEINNLFIENISQKQIIEQIGPDNLKDDLKTMLSFDYDTYLLNDIMVKVDRATMHCSLEGREPLLDHRIIEYAATLPNEFKIKNGNRKYILKDIVHDYIPKEMMDRPKMGFAAPVDYWLRNDLKDKLDHYFSREFVSKQNIFDYAALLKVKQDYFNNKNKYSFKIWYILVFQMWYERWMLN